MQVLFFLSFLISVRLNISQTWVNCNTAVCGENFWSRQNLSSVLQSIKDITVPKRKWSLPVFSRYLFFGLGVLKKVKTWVRISLYCCIPLQVYTYMYWKNSAKTGQSSKVCIPSPRYMSMYWGLAWYFQQ